MSRRELDDSLFARFIDAAPDLRPQLAALRQISENAVEFTEHVINHGILARDQAGELMSNHLGLNYVNLSKILFDQDLPKLLPRDDALRLQAVLLYRMGDVISVALTRPDDPKITDELQLLIREPLSFVYSLPEEVDSAIRATYQARLNIDELIAQYRLAPLLRGELNDTQINTLIRSQDMLEIADALMLLALSQRASDMHIEPKKHNALVRLRIDGELHEQLIMPRELAIPLVSCFKIRAEMDIAERRKPQDGRINFAVANRRIDIRVNTLPVVHGEKMVLRFLGSLYNNAMLNLDKLDFVPHVLRPLKEILTRPSGILLATGPTGAGKTTTLYASLNYINRPTINVVTIEDPVEYEIATLNQVHVSERAGRTFASVLRAVLRQDPDVILLGEIRDLETANIAMQAALTGHLVLATLHTNNVLQTPMRLIDMGVDRHTLAPALAGILNQRLVRRLCEYCREPYTPDPAYLQQYFHIPDGAPLPRLYRAGGCPHCEGSGYNGRIGIHELLSIDNALREAIASGATVQQLSQLARTTNYRNLRYDGLKKALRGLTTIDEVIRITTDDIDIQRQLHLGTRAAAR